MKWLPYSGATPIGVAERNELTKEGEDVRRFYPLRLQFDHLINFPAALTLHVRRSPFIL